MSDGRVAARLVELGLTLHGPHPPHDPLDAVVIYNGTARTSGQLPRIDGKLTCLGRLGDTVTVEEGREAAAVCALNALAVLHAALGSLDRVERVLTVTGFVVVGPRLLRAARCGRRGEPGAGRCLRGGRPPHPVGHRGGGAAPERGGRNRGDGRPQE